jgi:type II secretory pathway component PulF
MAFPAAQKHLFYTELAKLLEAGFGIREAAAVMLETKPPGAQVKLLRELDRQLEAGKPITEAFGWGTALITPLEHGIIGAGERGGRLPSAFQHLANYFEMLAKARRSALQAMIYPLVLLHLGVFVAVVPAALMGGDKDFTEVLGSFFLALLALYAVCAVIWLGVRALLRAARNHPRVDSMLNRVPYLGKARRSMAMARFTMVYHTCLLAGLPMRETVASATTASRSGLIIEAGRRLGKTLEQGGPLGAEFVACGAFPGAFARSYATAEEAGGLDRDLARWSALYHDDASRATKALSVALPKFFYALIVVFVVWRIISFWSGYYGMIEELSE